MAIQCANFEVVIYTGNGGPGFTGNGYKASDIPRPYTSYPFTLASVGLRGTLLAAWYQVEQGFPQLSAFDTIIVTQDVNNPSGAFVIDLSASAPLQNAWIVIRCYLLYDSQ
jgi:hypothetical protein